MATRRAEEPGGQPNPRARGLLRGIRSHQDETHAPEPPTPEELHKVRRFQHGSRVPGWDDAVDLDKDPAGVPDLALADVPDDLREEIEAAMARYPDPRSAVIPALHAAQRRHGWCSPEAQAQVAAVMRLTPAYIEAIVGFYDMFEERPVGPHTVYVCTNISCSLRGADAMYEAMLDAAGDDAAFNVRSFECLGACDIAPMASVDGEYVGPLELADAPRIVEDCRAGRPVLPDKQLRRRPAAGQPRPVPVSDAAAVGGADRAFGPSAAADNPQEADDV
jgi:NADH:ubiquinone oxidoreductase subunit E